MASGVDSVEQRAAALFNSSRPLALAEHLGISMDAGAAPACRGVERLSGARGTELLWTAAGEGLEPLMAVSLRLTAGASIPIFARVVSDEAAQRLLAECGGRWFRAAALEDGDGRSVASIWRARDGRVFLPFDPDEVCHLFWSEGYLNAAPDRWAGGRRRALRSYYRARRLLPRTTQIWLRRRYSRTQMRTPFPRWPLEPALHDFFDLFMSILAEIGGEPVPRIAPWPHGHRWAFVLTHDVETAMGLAAVDPIVALERELGLRSSWNIVPQRYRVDEEVVRDLAADGFEIGVHGLRHDGKDLESLARVSERLPGMREAADRWGAVGFRSPATLREWTLMPRLGFDYDSSYPDTDPFEPQGGGCCTWLPYFNGEMVELPLTMAQDHTLFVILRESDDTLWVRKAELLRERGGMALIDTHPDYLIDDGIRAAYGRLLQRYAGDATAWKALPREVSAWWRRRAASRIERVGADLVIDGPAGEAHVELVEGTPWS
jgi:peptidoglycan/xylan/chitin deacetylase (PgdA/CDA1 family)